MTNLELKQTKNTKSTVYRKDSFHSQKSVSTISPEYLFRLLGKHH